MTGFQACISFIQPLKILSLWNHSVLAFLVCPHTAFTHRRQVRMTHSPPSWYPEGSNLARPRGHLIQSLLITLHWAVLLTLSVSMHLGAGCEEAVDTLVLWIQASVLCNPTSEFPMVRSAVRLSHEGSQKHQYTVMHPWSITQT